MANSNTALRSDVERAARELIESGDSEGAEIYLERANKLLEEMGARPVERPLTREERIEKMIQQRENNQ